MDPNSKRQGWFVLQNWLLFGTSVARPPSLSNDDLYGNIRRLIRSTSVSRIMNEGNEGFGIPFINAPARQYDFKGFHKEITRTGMT